jgi:polyhydroxyalkanoate synthesis regulator phasin
MPKRKAKFDQAKQSAQFKKAAQDMVDAGELDPIEAERALDAVVRRAKTAGAAHDDEPPPQ